MTDPDLNPTPEARIAMIIWSNEYAYGKLGSMGFWKALSNGRQDTCRRALADVAKAAISHGRTLEDLAGVSPMTATGREPKLMEAPQRLWIWFADKKEWEQLYIRQWQSTPFGDGTEYIRADFAPTPPNTVGSGELDAAVEAATEAYVASMYGSTSDYTKRENIDAARPYIRAILATFAALPVDRPEVVVKPAATAGIERHHIQALGAALSRRDWCATEVAYHNIRYHFETAERSVFAALQPSDSPALDAGEAEAAMDAFERLLTYGRRPEGAGTTFRFNPGFFFLSDIDANTIRAALSPTRETGK